MRRVINMRSLVTSVLLVACTDASVDPFDGEAIKEDGKSDSSALAVFVDATWQGRLIADSSWNDLSTVESQLFYTVGQLNGMSSVGRIDKAEVTDIVKTTVDGRIEIQYTAKLLVAWGKKNNVPATIPLKLPLDISSSGQQAFVTKYGTKCVDFSAHDVTSGSMFYYFRPARPGCVIDPADVHTVDATVTPSPVQSTGKFPEYHKVWEDGRLEVVAIFGKDKASATANSDVGISAYNRFAQAINTELANRELVTTPATVPTSPGVGMPDIEYVATLPDGKIIRVVALLTNNIQSALQQPEFRARYESLTTRADYISYNGHAGLGTNVRAMANAGNWVQGQYVIVQLNGCDTFAYIDDALNTAHQAVNPDDTTGFKYIDLVNNAMPAYFSQLSNTTMVMVKGLISHAEPKTFEQIFTGVDRAQVVLVSGEQDNVYTPGGGGEPEEWDGLTDSGTLAQSEERRHETPTVAAGDYEFTITGTGDADLYVRVGNAPTTTQYDCRPYKTGSNESCRVTLAQPTKIHVMVRGYSQSSTFELVGQQL
jgi:hypothetical protein